MALSSSSVKRKRRALPVLPPEGSRESVIKQKFEIPEFDVERLHRLPPKILSQINAVDKDNTVVRGKVEDLKDKDFSKRGGKTSQITLKSGKKLEISLVEGSFRRIAGIREQHDDSGSFTMRTVEIKREPGKSLGFYIRQGDGWMRKDGIFVSRINLGSLVEVNGLLHVGDEIIKVNSVDVSDLSLDDVVVIMQYVKKMVLTIKILTSVTLVRTFSTRMQKRTPKPVATVRRTSSYAEKIAMRQNSDSLSDNGEVRYGNPYEDIKLEPLTTTTPATTTTVEIHPDEQPQTATTTSEHQKSAVTTSSFDTGINLGNSYEDIEFDDEKNEENVEDTKLNKPQVHASPTYEEIAVTASSESKTPSIKHDITSWEDNKEQHESEPPPIASSTPVLHRKLDTSTSAQQEVESPLPNDSESLQLNDSKEEFVQESSLDMEDMNGRHISFDAPPTFKPPPPPPADESNVEDKTADESNPADGKSSSHELNLTNVTNEETTTSLDISSILKLESDDDDENADTHSESEPPPLPPFHLNIDDDSDEEPPDSLPPPLPSMPPPSAEQEESNSSLPLIDLADLNNATQPSLLSQENSSQEDHSLDKESDLVFSGMLAATIYGLDESTVSSQNGKRDTFSCTIAIDSVLRVRHIFKCSENSLEQSLGEELDPFHIDLQNNKGAIIRLYKNEEEILEKAVQFIDLFGQDASKESPVHELNLTANPLGKVTLSLEYQPMPVFVKRMSSETSLFSCATFEDYVNTSPNSSEYPLVVEQCIAIIEQHGLREPGLYELCVSESSKNEALQVCLSQTMKQAEVKAVVSQLSVHAFTGVLKDFFRNLPEPLLTNDISLNITETASMENATKVGGDVMKGFIDCLPDEVISSLQLLLQHFKHACLYSSNNGLTVEKISQIFGPLLLTPACNVDKNTSMCSAEFAEDYDSQAKAIEILLSLRKIESPPYIMHKV